MHNTRTNIHGCTNLLDQTMKNDLSIAGDFQQIIDQIASVAALLEQKGWAEGNAGNLSVNITGIDGVPLSQEKMQGTGAHLPRTFGSLSGQCFLISGAGTRMRNMARFPDRNLVCIHIDRDGSTYRTFSLASHGDPGLLPTSEVPSHLAIHEHLLQQARPEKAILHTHVNELIALTLDPLISTGAELNRVLGSVLPEIKIMIPKGVGLVAYLTPGTEEIACATVESLQQHDVILWSKHGVVAVGTDLHDCLDKIEVITKAAKIYFLCRNTGTFSN